MPSIAEHLNWAVKQRWHRRVATCVLATPPIVPVDDRVVLFSMIGTGTMLPYLVAVKSLHQHLGRGRVVILDDGTLTDADRAVLARHLADPRIIPIADVATDPCPPGNVWERILAILDLRADDYIIQFDSDTVTLGPVPEVAAAIDARRSFTLLGEAGATLLPAAAFVAGRRKVDPRDPRTHVQDASEAVMDQVRVPGRDTLHYVRGCAGFVGFAPSDDGRALVEGLSVAMDQLIGRSQWERWGSEQVASNVVVANDPAPVLLPYDRYLNFWNRGMPKDAALVHFIGTYRFHGRAYLNATRDAIARLHAN